MASKKSRTRKAQSYNRKPKNLNDKSRKREPFIVFSFRDLDRNQGQSFEEWEKDELLAKACKKLREINALTITQTIHQKIIKVYNNVDFPPNSEFTHPKHVP